MDSTCQTIQDIETPALALRACQVEEHCQALRSIRGLSFWWYLGQSRWFGQFSLPFKDASGAWWYQVKPGLSWAADFYAALNPLQVRIPLFRSFFGYQHVVESENHANSHFVINTIKDLSAYGVRSIDAKRRNSIRKGFRSCTLEVLDAFDRETFHQCRMAWKDLTDRTGWKHAVEEVEFNRTWKLLLQCPGVSIIVGREKTSGQVAGFLVTKIIGNTAYVDTIASRTDFLKYNVNDAVMYAFLMNSQLLPGVSMAHYAIKSYDEKLEQFKTGLGFVPEAFPACTILRGPTGSILKALYPEKHRRMFGIFQPEPSKPKVA